MIRLLKIFIGLPTFGLLLTGFRFEVAHQRQYWLDDSVESPTCETLSLSTHQRRFFSSRLYVAVPLCTSPSINQSTGQCPQPDLVDWNQLSDCLDIQCGPKPTAAICGPGLLIFHWHSIRPSLDAIIFVIFHLRNK